MKRTTKIATFVVPLALVLLAGPGAGATFPGSNGLIVFGRAGDVWVVDADGNTTRLTDTTHPREGLVD